MVTLRGSVFPVGDIANCHPPFPPDPSFALLVHHRNPPSFALHVLCTSAPLSPLNMIDARSLERRYLQLRAGDGEGTHSSFSHPFQHVLAVDAHTRRLHIGILSGPQARQPLSKVPPRLAWLRRGAYPVVVALERSATP